MPRSPSGRFVAPETTEPFAESFFVYVWSHEGPSMTVHAQRQADREQVLDLLRARSIYQLKEADPTTWAVPGGRQARSWR